VSTRDDGAGMGVVLALSAVEQSGGTLSITDRADGGTLAKVLLPLACHRCGSGAMGGESRIAGGADRHRASCCWWTMTRYSRACSGAR